MEDKIVTLESYYDPMLAEIILARLAANGIPCFLADENTLSANPFYNQAIGGIKIKVFEHDLEKCREILAEKFIPQSADEEPLSCPNCGSVNVSYGSATFKKNWFSIIISALISTFPVYLRRTWICADCGANFDSPAGK
ncbi:DUF2007 domain-containing protein [Mucilaginibacter sp. UR6-11]|uniref:putative signal transducing protein n=1 Tax=Mucilaginibacter sp. UR6-11 TaxID=1435644 RepID=UPI001E5C401C|nr:DUF2007 domain-containing protein [Mucilaginibacter sp. UR6-11]MCC8423352.1 DUF2007 domain-containing protein [Mucilaginibacter sp. UR6-11]